MPLRILQSDEDGFSSSNEAVMSGQSRSDTPNLVDDALEGVNQPATLSYTLKRVSRAVFCLSFQGSKSLGQPLPSTKPSIESPPYPER